MGLIELLILLVIAGICGAIAEWIVGFSPGGFVVSIIVGLIGAYLGSWLAGRIGLPPVLPVSRLGLESSLGLLNFDIVWSILGSILLLLVISLIRGTGRRRRRRLL
ncbi:hypothetical protein [Kallotenue papyrolyticum]|uniref:hypothetical protein n=1 Tax=Kallotenue papyrolyticum TaxID=1325125 RepID=UPI0004785D49|nr:hypothetical protein [Kallotenue papyrolyticum]